MLGESDGPIPAHLKPSDSTLTQKDRKMMLKLKKRANLPLYELFVDTAYQQLLCHHLIGTEV